MKALLISICSIALLAKIGAAQDTTRQAAFPQNSNAQQPQPTPMGTTERAGPATRVAPGSVIPVSLTKTIDAKKAKSGDEVVVKVIKDLKSNSGEVLLAKDTKIVGHVTAAQARSKEQKESLLAIAFDRAEMKDGVQMQLPMSIQAIIAAANPNSGNDNNQQSSMTGGVAPGGVPSPSAGGRSPATGGSAMPPPVQNPSSESASPGPQTGSSRAPITAETKGVVGIADLNLAVAPSDRGSLLTSDKNNVKLESGTLMLLRVNR